MVFYEVGFNINWEMVKRKKVGVYICISRNTKNANIFFSGKIIGCVMLEIMFRFGKLSSQR